MNWIQKANERMRNSILSKKEEGITEKVIKRKQASFEGGIANKGRTHSEETKKVWSERKRGKKLPKEQVEKARVGIIQTKWEQSLQRLSKEDILAAQEKHGNHQQNTMKELGVSFHLYKKLCKHYGLEKKKSNKEKCEYAIQNQSEKIMVYQCSKREPYRPVGKPKIFYSVSQCCRELQLHKGNMLRNMRNGTPYRNMFFKK